MPDARKPRGPAAPGAASAAKRQWQAPGVAGPLGPRTNLQVYMRSGALGVLTLMHTLKHFFYKLRIKVIEILRTPARHESLINND